MVSGIVTTPGTAALLVSGGTPVNGQYRVTITANVGGTVAVADFANIQFIYNGGLTWTIPNGTKESPVTASFLVQMNGTNACSVNSIATGTTGAVYAVLLEMHLVDNPV